MLFEIGLLIVAYFVIPIAFLIWLWWGEDRSKLDWLLKLLIVALYSVHIFLSGRWDLFSYYLRYLLAICFVIVAYRSVIKAKSLPLYPLKNIKNYLVLGINGLVIVFFLSLLSSYIPHGYLFAGAPVQLSFPLMHGTYYVGQGGNSPAINYHNSNPTQRYALDIVKLNALGNRANGIYPRSLTNYSIFGEPLYSPCSGTVSNTVNDLPDQNPPTRDRQNLAGNHIQLQCKNADVLMAHLQRGSLTVREGESVKVGQVIAKIGNSGNTTEPHLHIHARKENTGTSILDGEGLPMVFDNDFLVRNSILFLK